MSAHYRPGLPITHISKGYMISNRASIHQGIQGVTGMFLHCESEGGSLNVMLMEFVPWQALTGGI